jgi:hypothetical protein
MLWKNVRSLCRLGSLKRVSGELAKYKSDLGGVQEVRWDKSGTEPTGDYTFSYGNGNADHLLGTSFLVHKRIMSAVKRVEFVSDRMSYTECPGKKCQDFII